MNDTLVVLLGSIATLFLLGVFALVFRPHEGPDPLGVVRVARVELFATSLHEVRLGRTEARLALVDHEHAVVDHVPETLAERYVWFTPWRYWRIGSKLGDAQG